MTVRAGSAEYDSLAAKWWRFSTNFFQIFARGAKIWKK
jgi:hypothetical protein